MNTKEVRAMIDAITEGREWQNIWIDNDGDRLGFTADNGSVLIRAASLFAISDPRIAREIAAALVAWANRKEASVSEPIETATSIFYTRDDNSTRHYVIPHRMAMSNVTVCGELAYRPEILALPVNCSECRNGLAENMLRDTEEGAKDV